MFQPLVDINLFVHDGAATVAAAIDSVRAQTYPNWRLTLIDDGSTDGTGDILAWYAARFPNIALKRLRANVGAIGAFQRGLWLGDADYVMPKSADDLITPDFLARLMDVLAAHPDCVMAHAGGLGFHGRCEVGFVYPASHNLAAVGADPVDRAASVMRSYTSSPAFWGVYRRDAIDRLAPIAHRAGWDHVLLAELALYGEIRHVADILYWRRGEGRPLRQLARAATREAERGLCLEDESADALWRMPILTIAYAHMENFRLARLPPAERARLLEATGQVFRARWGAPMRQEARLAADYVAVTARGVRREPVAIRLPALLRLAELLAAIASVLPDFALDRARDALADSLRDRVECAA